MSHAPMIVDPSGEWGELERLLCKKVKRKLKHQFNRIGNFVQFSSILCKTKTKKESQAHSILVESWHNVCTLFCNAQQVFCGSAFWSSFCRLSRGKRRLSSGRRCGSCHFGPSCYLLRSLFLPWIWCLKPRRKNMNSSFQNHNCCPYSLVVDGDSSNDKILFSCHLFSCTGFCSSLFPARTKINHASSPVLEECEFRILDSTSCWQLPHRWQSFDWLIPVLIFCCLLQRFQSFLVATLLTFHESSSV